MYYKNIQHDKSHIVRKCIFHSLAPSLKRHKANASGLGKLRQVPHKINHIGKNEYTKRLCASCIIFIVKALNYCIVSLMTHFLVS